MRGLFAIPVALIGAAPSAAQSPPVPDLPAPPACTFDRPAHLVERKADLPPDARAEIDRQFATLGGMAEAGAWFETGDAYSGHPPMARFIRAYNVDDKWIIWFWRGGIALFQGTLALAPVKDQTSGKPALRMVPGSHFGGDLCVSSKAFFAGALSAGG